MANRYWVGNGGTWDTSSTTHWSDISGGGGGFSVPGVDDSVFFDGNSFSLTGQVVTLSSPGGVRNLDFTGVTNTPTIAGSSAITIGVSTLGGIQTLTFSAGMILTFTGGIVFANSRHIHLTMAGLTLPGTNSMTCGVSGAIGDRLTLLDDCNFGTRAFSVLGGTFNTNNFNFTITGTFTISSGSGGTSVINLGSGSFTCGDWIATTIGGGSTLTINSGTSTINLIGNNLLFANGSISRTYYNVNFSGTGSVANLSNINGSGTITFNNLTITGNPAIATSAKISQNIIVSNTLTLSGNSTTNRMTIKTGSWGLVKTITAATVSLANLDFFDTTAAGAASPFSGTSLGDGGGNSNITFTPAVTRYWVSNGGNWSSTTHWSTVSGGGGGSSVPLVQDSVIFDTNSFSSGGQTVTMDMPYLGTTVTASSVSNSPIFSNDQRDTAVFGDLTLGVMTFSGTNYLLLRSRTNQSITTNSASFPFAVYYTIGEATGSGISSSFSGGTLTLQDNLSTNKFLAIETGGFNGNNKNITAGAFVLDAQNTTATTINFGTGTYTLSGTEIPQTGGDTYFIYINDSPSHTITSSSASVIVNAVAGLTGYMQATDNAYPDITLSAITINGSTGTAGTVVLYDQITATSITIQNDKLVVVFDGSTPLTQTCTTFNANGNSSDNIILRSNVPGSEWFVSASTANCSFLTLSDSHALGAAIPFQNSGGVDNGGNTNWEFVSGGAFLLNFV